MKAIVSHGTEDFRLEERPVPDVGPDDVLIEIDFCGICGTDVHQFHGTWELNPGCTPGHELSGVIREVGAQVTRFKAGERVSADPGITCGACANCRSARSHLCPQRYSIYHYKGGGFAEFTSIPSRQVYRLPDGMPLEWGAFLEPAACCVHCIDRAAIRPGQSVAVLGGGAIGLMLVQLALLSGASQLILAEPQANRRRIAESLGATHTIDPLRQDTVEAVKDLSAGGVDVVIESAGLAATVAQGFEAIKSGGKIVLFGVNKPDTRVDFSPYMAVRKEISLLGAILSGDACPRTVELIASEKLRVQPLISHVLPLSDFHKGLQMHARQEGVKILVTPK